MAAEGYKAVKTLALRKAILGAPHDISGEKELTNISTLSIQKMCEVGQPNGYIKTIFPHSFKDMYRATTRKLKGDEEKEAFNRYLFSTATEYASTMMLFRFPSLKGEKKTQTLERLKNQTDYFFTYQFLAANYLLQGLTTKGSKEYVKIEEEMTAALRKDIVEKTVPKVAELIAKTFVDKPAIGKALTFLASEALVTDTKRDFFIAETVDVAKKEFLKGTSKKPPIRFMMGIYNKVAEYCRDNKIKNPLLNLTLGDVTGLSMSEKVAEALALNPAGPKGLALAARANMYRQLAYMSAATSVERRSDDVQRYEPNSLGWQGLRDKFIQYGQEFGLYTGENQATGSIIGEGGADALFRIASIINVKLQQKNMELPEKDRIPAGQKFKAYFANPAFRMVSAKVRLAGFDVFEEQTTLGTSFRPDLKAVNDYLTKNKDCKVFVYVPINNPSSDITEKEYMDRLIKILRDHGTILINDMAYLGTGDIEANKKLAQSINTYENRVDVYSMSKIFGRTGLRCGCAVSTIKDLSEEFDIVPIAQNIQLGNAHPMQETALATWDLVGSKDRELLNKHYKSQQQRIIDKLRKIDLKRKQDGKKSLVDWDKKIFADAALYAYVPLADGIDAFDVIREAGLVGTPDRGFYQNEIAEGEIRYLRFALGVTKRLEM